MRIAKQRTTRVLGIESYNLFTEPVGAFTELAVGGDSACVLDSTGLATCWGYDADGQVSNTPSDTFL